jgi:hypothetical protein
MGECTECRPFQGWKVALFLLFASGALLVVARRYKQHLHKAVIMPYVKIIISFFTVAATVDTNYGVIWPEAFARVLEVMSVMSLKMPALAQLVCAAELNVFFHRLQIQVLLCLVLLLTIHFGSNWQRLWWPREWSWYGGTYFLVFVYPTMSTEIIKVFSCTEISGKFYLRADFSRECYMPEWKANAAYAGILVVVFVVGFPLLVLTKLWSYRRHGSNNIASKSAMQTTGSTERVDLAFLRHDYKVIEPSWLHATQVWESVEIVRKLSLSVVSAFFSTKSTMCIATALLISSGFLVVHCHFYAWKKPTWNRLQTLSLTILTLMYFCGLLIKTQHLEEDAEQHKSIGSFLVFLVLVMFATVLGAMAHQIVAVVRWTKELKYVEAQVEEDPSFDPSLHDHIISPSELKMGRVLGEGAEGTVRLAHYAGVEVAVKITRVSAYNGVGLEELLKEAQLEAQTLQPLRHPVGT